MERYATPLLSSDPASSLTREENQILALQNIHRLNQCIGMLARKTKERTSDLKALQSFVNSLTIGVKSNNIPQMKYGLSQARNLIATLHDEL